MALAYRFCESRASGHRRPQIHVAERALATVIGCSGLAHFPSRSLTARRDLDYR